MAKKSDSVEPKFLSGLADRLVDDVEAFKQRVFVHHDGRAHAQDVTGRNPGEAFLKGVLIDAFAGLIERLLRRAVLHELDAHQASLRPNIADDTVFGLHFFHAVEGDIAEVLGILEQLLLFDYFGRSQAAAQAMGLPP